MIRLIHNRKEVKLMRKVKELFDKVKSNKKMTIITFGLLITLILTWGG